ncbi:hypothetical protein [Rubrivivax rivuli]|jgi:hypothetical protein|uniref:Uncharacterized protein n=1 Tax=Rubrivivax rivuli TaxID=1862385 RepID=A0A437RSF6_9BURK|nr:hypothetical protein [Rubrivivax rivuli]RVU49688.1 hypothetical protein EOE66_03800 [Rubrivivax rivuli]
MQSHLLPPEAWRSEAFAEDLFEPAQPSPVVPARQLRTGRLLLSVLPVMLVLAGALALGLGVA